MAAEALLLLIAGLAPGCISYEPRPLDPAAALAAMEARRPSSAGEFAQVLAAREGLAPAFDPSDGLTLAEAEPVALVFNRDLRAARAAAGIARANSQFAGLWDDPIVGIDLERIISGVPDPWVIAGTIGITVPISGQLEARKSLASAELSAELQRLAGREWQVRTALRERWIEWSAAAHRVRLAADRLEQLRTILDIMAKQERAGVISRAESRSLRVELVSGEVDHTIAESEAAALRLELLDLLGLFPEAPVVLIETLAPPLHSPAVEGIDRTNPQLAVARSEYEVAEEALRLEVRRQYPDLAIGPGFGSDEGDERILLGLQLPLPLWNRNRHAIAEASARRDAARVEFETAYERVITQTKTAAARREAARRLREIIESRLIPLADEQSEELRTIAGLGRVEPLLLLEALQSQHDAKVRLIEARAAEAQAAISLAHILGPPAAPEAGAPADPGESRP